ncbi:MAG TPA: methyltransferase [Candidatus Sulfopaludibacter sp.]|nr:methyltransferase [Candidatus Sulfopaludibacter sp.]
MKQQLYFFDVIAFLIMAAVLWVTMPASPRFYAGMALTAVSFVFWIVARLQLGASFAIAARAHKLVTTGLYSRFRNPVYLFAQIAYLGLAIAWGRAVGYIVLVVMAIGQWTRAKKEEAVLERAFGDEYRSYKSRTLF